MTHSALVAGAALLLCAAATPSGAEGPDGDTWWRSPPVQSQIGLTARQVSQLDAIYRDSLPERRRLRQELDTERQHLAQVLDKGVLDDASAERVVVRVFDAERQRNVARTLLLFRMYRVLSPEQHAALTRLGLLRK